MRYAELIEDNLKMFDIFFLDNSLKLLIVFKIIALEGMGDMNVPLIHWYWKQGLIWMSQISSQQFMDDIFKFLFNTLRPRQNGRLFADDTLKRIFLNENIRIAIKISLKFVPTGPINNNPALVLIMTSRWPGDKPLSEPMLVRLLTHLCVTWPQWVNNFLYLFRLHWIFHKESPFAYKSSVAETMAWC